MEVMAFTPESTWIAYLELYSSLLSSAEVAASNSRSNGADLPATDRFALIECRLHINAAPHRRPSPPIGTPHWRSISTGPTEEMVSWSGGRANGKAGHRMARIC
ncbi:hypothetical protein CH063_13235 [Colletotrichum higginsianum]|uniref:Uncharacterized protein n=1 Tax=Colletotrichum higginsianum (strain IMI 349063) TaxID=759273 RepID=H1VTL7_COLHI|nr:hypothetical protein CH063_13235 [Colletotrichum higginsianum]